MKSEKFFCKGCKRFFDEPKYYNERHGLDNPPFERVAVCSICGGDDFTRHKNLIEKIEVADKILPAVMYLNKYYNALKDVYGISLKNEELDNSVEMLVELISEMFEFLDNDVQKKIFDVCSEGELQRILTSLRG